MLPTEEVIARLVGEVVRRVTSPYRQVLAIHHRAGHVSDLEMDQIDREVAEVVEDLPQIVRDTLRTDRA